MIALATVRYTNQLAIVKKLIPLTHMYCLAKLTVSLQKRMDYFNLGLPELHTYFEIVPLCEYVTSLTAIVLHSWLEHYVCLACQVVNTPLGVYPAGIRNSLLVQEILL